MLNFWNIQGIKLKFWVQNSIQDLRNYVYYYWTILYDFEIRYL